MEGLIPMIRSVIKRDGRRVLYDQTKIASAILRAMEAVREGNAEDAARVADSVEAKLEAIRERGGNDFQEFLLPNAILKFKQGVGRLIRTREDVGQVVLLDERVHTKTYGRQFLEALPDCRLRVDVFN